MLKVHSFKIDEDLLVKIKVYCASKKITLCEFVAKALKMYLDSVLKR